MLRITQPGRAYLQVGNNEIYESFHRLSGARYAPTVESRTEEVDNEFADQWAGQYEL